MLNNFFRINLPYGIAKNEDGSWMAFNREYMPLGYNDYDYKLNPGTSYMELPIYTHYKKMTDKFLIGLADSENSIELNEEKEIVRVFLYHDGTNPTNFDTPTNWKNYFDKLKRLARLSVFDEIEKRQGKHLRKSTKKIA